MRLRRKNAREAAARNNNRGLAIATSTSDATETERGTSDLPRGGGKTFADVLAARERDAAVSVAATDAPQSKSKTFADVLAAREREAAATAARSANRDSAGSNPFADRPPEMTAIGGARDYSRNSERDYDRRSYSNRSFHSRYDRRSYDRGSYDRRSYDRRSDDRRSDDSRSYGRGYDAVYDRAAARSQRDPDQRSLGSLARSDSISTTRTSRLAYDEKRRDIQASRYSARDGDRRRSDDYFTAELDVPEPAATYLRDPFSDPDPKSPASSRRRSDKRPASPKLYLYPEQTDRDVNDEEEEDRRKTKRQSTAESERSQPKPVNYLPVFQKPLFAQLPGKSGAIVEMI